jgi:hypothetical protein
MWVPSLVGNELVGIGRLHLRQTIVSEQFPEFGETGADERMAGKMGLYGY